MPKTSFYIWMRRCIIVIIIIIINFNYPIYISVEGKQIVSNNS